MPQVRVRKMNNPEPSLKGRKVVNDVKTSGSPAHWEKWERNLFTISHGVRPKGGISLTQASARNAGTCRPDAKGNAQVAQTARAKVPMRGTGAERSVVVMKLTKVSGAKGSCYCRRAHGSTVKAGGI